MCIHTYFYYFLVYMLFIIYKKKKFNIHILYSLYETKLHKLE